MSRQHRQPSAAPCLALALGLLLGGCGGDPAGGDGATTGPETLTVWYHTGKPAERATLQAQVAAFEAAHPAIPVDLVLIPEASYNQQVQAAASAGKLPDVFDLDGPWLANYAWKGQLQPLDEHLPAELMDDLLPSIRAQGSYAGRFWGVGTFDSGLGLYVDTAALRRLHEDAPAVPATPAAAWDADTFTTLLRELGAAERSAGGDGAVIDLHLDYSGEWDTYAFAPVLWSAGAALVSDTEPPQASGQLDSEAAVAALDVVRGWIAEGLVDANQDGRAFLDGRVVFSWSGHWDHPGFVAAHGDDLALAPLPDFGEGSRTGQGSWVWAIGADSTQPAEAAAFIEFLLQTEEVVRMCEANGAVPATGSAIAAMPAYQEGGPLRLFVEQLQHSAVPRPVTPAYPVITSAFQEAFDAVRHDGDVAAALTRAAATIDADIAANEGYPAP